MNHDASTDALNRVLTVLYRSLPMYLAEADPWIRAGDERGSQVLARIVEDQRRDANRLAEFIISRAARVQLGEMPMEFTDLNFLSLDYLLKELIRHQQQDIAQIERCVALLSHDRPAGELIEEILGSERAHLEALQELSRQPVPQ